VTTLADLCKSFESHDVRQMIAAVRGVAEVVEPERLEVLDSVLQRLEMLGLGLVLLAHGSELNTRAEIRQGAEHLREELERFTDLGDELCSEALAKLHTPTKEKI
jgi:signal transduction histidine kinase